MATPSDSELLAAVTAARDAHADLGVLKLWAALKAEHPEWAVSEKRFRKSLAAAGGTASGGGAAAPAPAKKGKSKGGVKAGELVARTGLDATLDVGAAAPKVRTKMFGGTRGKGLVAKSGVEAGEVLWQEEPWIACSDPSLKPHLVDKALCTHCLAKFDRPNPPLSVECPACSDAHFCNRLCLSRARGSASHHDLLCEGVNPAARALNKLVAAREWRALDVAARIVARWRGERAWGPPGAADEVATRVWEGIARVNMETRESEKADWPARKEFTQRQWAAGHEALVGALNPSEPAAARRLHQALASRAKGRKPAPLTDDEVARWFSYESFLELLGMVNINLEDGGGMYALHAHLNHSCEPNVQVRNLPKSFVPPTLLPAELPGRNPPGVRGTHKLTMLARGPIPAGTELTISYVDLSLPRAVRRQALRDGYGFWCACARCEREKADEEREEKKKRKADGELAAQMEELAVDDML